MQLRLWYIGLFGLIIFISITGFAWCYGLWGRDIVFLQYLFQCRCPQHSETFRYPDRVEVVIPACKLSKSSLRVSPDGYWVDVDSKYILDLNTGKKITLPNSDGFITISQGLVLLNPLEYEPEVYDVYNHTRYKVDRLDNLPKTDDDRIDPIAVLSLLHTAQKIFVLSEIILIKVDDTQYYIVRERELTGHSRDGRLARDFLNANQIRYEFSVDYLSDELPSHNRVFIEKPDGIYLVATNERIAENYQFLNSSYPASPIGWQHDDQGVFVHDRTVWVIDYQLPNFLLGGWRLFQVPQPLLLLKVPPEYLPPTP